MCDPRLPNNLLLQPTSGLDAQGAWNIVRFLRKLADQGQAILCTIHQPSSLLFESFDRLLLLETGGETVYFGDIGPDSKFIREYLARHGATCPPNVNPAEFMLEVTSYYFSIHLFSLNASVSTRRPSEPELLPGSATVTGMIYGWTLLNIIKYSTRLPISKRKDRNSR
jgi:energy-coupling factor transporter ATP-binding protein EcfA2